MIKIRLGGQNELVPLFSYISYKPYYKKGKQHAA